MFNLPKPSSSISAIMSRIKLSNLDTFGRFSFNSFSKQILKDFHQAATSTKTAQDGRWKDTYIGTGFGRKVPPSYIGVVSSELRKP